MLDLSGKIRIADTTLRDGEQAPGVVFPLREKVKIAALLDELGVDEAEIGSPALSSREVREIKTILAQGFRFASSCWCRADRSDLMAALKTGVDIVNISFPVSDIILGAMEHDRDWLLHRLDDILDFADRTFPAYSVGLQDVGRADAGFLFKVLLRIGAGRAFRVRLADTVGILNPMSVSSLLRRIRPVRPSLKLEFHAHNDLGMAVANTVAAAASGADYLSVTVNGLGERAGNCPLEELLFALKFSLKKRFLWDSAVLLRLCRLVSELSDRAVPADKPVTGSMVVCHESGTHVRCLIKNPVAYLPFAPTELDGRKHEFVIGKHSGLAAVNAFFHLRGIDFDAATGRDLLKRIKISASRRKRSLTETELMQLYRRCVDAAGVIKTSDGK